MNDISLLRSPLSLLLAALFVTGLLLLAKYRSTSGFFRLLSRNRVVVCAVLMPLCFAFLAVEGSYGLGLQHNPAFLTLVFLVMLCLGAAVCDSLIDSAKASRYLSHLGLFLILFGAYFGAPDFRDATMAVSKGESNYIAISPNGRTEILPFSVSLTEFTTDYYDDGISPKQYTSTLDIDGKTFKTSVNHPCMHKGWMIFQSGYDRTNPDMSVLKLVRDPWLPVIFLGMLVLAAGCVLSVRGAWKSRLVLPATLLLAFVFALISLARIEFGTLMPALRSLWFVPHLIIYMLAYSILAISLVLGVVFLMRKGDGKFGQLSFSLLNTASSLLVLGMLCGAVWAKMAWGDYWTWDSKECWAAATWLLTLLAIHLPHPLGKNRKLMVVMILLSFLAIQVTWYGVNYLPASQKSLHTYNVE